MPDRMPGGISQYILNILPDRMSESMPKKYYIEC